jgi:hypothetical protein
MIPEAGSNPRCEVKLKYGRRPATMTSSSLLPLDSPEATLERVGGKGASLARMVAAGLPVPPGFHITTDAYRRYVEENHLGGAILSAAAQARAEDPATLERASAEIQSLIAQGALPSDIANLIRQWYGELGADVPVAVRSSATAEDLPGLSFAGQIETYLNVRGGDNVADAVRRCWASLWTARAIGYRQRQGIRPEDIGMGLSQAAMHIPIKAKVDVLEMLGAEIYLYLSSPEGSFMASSASQKASADKYLKLKASALSFIARVDPSVSTREGETVEVVFDLDRCHAFDAETEKAIF